MERRWIHVGRLRGDLEDRAGNAVGITNYIGAELHLTAKPILRNKHIAAVAIHGPGVGQA
jgi:hypothetical protein